MRQFLVVTVGVVLTLFIARGSAKAEPPRQEPVPAGCPSDADFNTADWLIDRAKTASINDLQALRASQKANQAGAGRRAPQCEEAALAVEKSRLAWKAAIDALPILMREQASEPIAVASVEPPATESEPMPGLTRHIPDIRYVVWAIRERD